MVETLTLLAGHPYFDAEKPSVFQRSWDQKWCVKWRDFYTRKNDEIFDTEAEAVAFAATICKPPLTVTDEGGDLGDADDFWRSL